jgi:hypothetical protein
MFTAKSPGDSEHDAVSASLQSSGLDATRLKWEKHWSNAISEGDFEWLVTEANCTSIRLPIGYFTLGPGFCHGTAFEDVGDVYVNAWAAVRELVRRARTYGVGVLLDLHALPGGANGQAHSGTSSGKAEFWGNRRNTEVMSRVLVFIAQEVRGGLDGVVGIQVVNEALWDAKGLYEWYEGLIRQIARVDESIPVYISDAWNLDRTLKWCRKRSPSGGGPRNPVVVDCHNYYTFSEEDRKKTPQMIIDAVPRSLAPLGGMAGKRSLADGGEIQVIIGEWSCVLDGQTWGRVRPEEKDGLLKQFGQSQCQTWQQTGGSYFWTYKMDWMDGGEWGFSEQTKKGNISPPFHLTLSAQEVKDRTQTAQEQRQQLASAARQQHEHYWNRAAPGKSFEHDLYSEGWDVGFSDAQTFFTMRVQSSLGDKAPRQGGDKIGCLEIWIKKRLLESGHREGFVWEWEQGIRAGIEAFYHAANI